MWHWTKMDKVVLKFYLVPKELTNIFIWARQETVNESRYKQFEVTPSLSTRQNLLKRYGNMKDMIWYGDMKNMGKYRRNKLEKTFDRSADHK